MKRRIFALICVLSILLPCVTINAAFSDIPNNTKEERVLNIIQKLGIMVGYEEDGVVTFKPEQPVTRAEFVTAIRNSINMWNNTSSGGDDDGILAELEGFNWLLHYLGSVDQQLELKYPEGTQTEGDGEAEVVKTGLWSDVTEEHWAYNNMRDMSVLGVIKGYPDGTFRPNNNVSYNEAVTIVLSLCGYADYAKITGGWPEGYTKLASKFNLNKGITSFGDTPLSRMEVATLIYNAFTLELVSPIESDSEDKKTFLNDIVGVTILEGTLEATDITTISSAEGLKPNTARVDGTNFTFNADSDIRDYIGQELRVFLKEVDDEYVMNTFEATNKEETKVIDIALFDDYSRNTFYYRKDADDTKLSEIEVRPGSTLIYNGKYLASYDKTTFETLNQGTITIIEKEDLDYDIIVVENFESGYIEKVNVKNMEIVDILKQGTTNALIELTSNDRLINYSLFDSEGNAIDLESMSEGAINYFVNDGYIKIYYTEKTVSGKVTNSHTDNGKTYLTIDGEEYTVAKQYLDYSGKTLAAGMTLKASLDRYGEIVWATDDISLDGYAYIISARKNYESEILIVKYFDFGQKTVVETNTAVDVRYIDNRNVTHYYDYNTLFDEIAANVGVAMLTFDKDGAISKITMALDEDVQKEGVLKKVLETSKDSAADNYMGKYIFRSSILAGQYYFNADTVVLSVPATRTRYESYKTIAGNRLGNYTNGIECKVYTFDVDSPYAKIAVVYAQSENSNLYERAPTYYVQKVTQTINSDNEFAKEVTVRNVATNEVSTFISTEDEEGKSAFDKAYDAFMAKKTYVVERGDVIHIAIDPVTDEVASARVIFDANGTNPAWCCGDSTNRPTACTKGHSLATGTIAGSSGWQYGTSTNTKYCNPVSYLWTGGQYGIKIQPGYSGDYDYTFGFIHSEKEGLMRITTQNLNEPLLEEDENFYWVYANLSSYKVRIIEDGNVTEGSLSDIHTYAQVGSRCDKILICHLYQQNVIYVLR